MSGRGLARVGSLIAGVSVAALLGGVPASADAVKATFTGHNASGHRVNLGGNYANMATTLFELKVADTGSVNAYCVEIDVRVDPSRPTFEQPWDAFPNPESPFHENRNDISWVLHHGYPANDLSALEQTLTENGASLHDGLSKKEAIAGTQAAVWHYSDVKDLDRKNPVPGNAQAGDDVLALYDYLTGEANEGIGEEPTPALEVSPKEKAGKAGDRIGPFTVSTTGDITGLTAELPGGVTLTDADGTELAASDITNGTEVYVDVPADAADGGGSFGLEASAHLATGRLFVSEDYEKKPAQSLIVAQSDTATLTTSASVSWEAASQPTTPPAETTTTPAPPTTSAPAGGAPTTQAPVSPQANSGELAQTGFSPLTPLLIGAGLIVVGAGAVLLQRRRKNV